MLPVKCVKCDSSFCIDHYKSDLSHNCMMSDAKCPNCGVRIDRVNDAAVARLNQERSLFKQQQQLDKASIRSLEKKLFDLSHELERARNDSIRFEEIQAENMSLSKDVFVLGEMYNRAVEKLEAMNSNHFLRSSQIADRSKMKTMEKELEKERLAAENRTRERDWFRGRCNELEEMLKKKETSLIECRKLMDTSLVENTAKLDTQSERIKALISIKKQLSDHILELNRKLGITPSEPQREHSSSLVFPHLVTSE